MEDIVNWIEKVEAQVERLSNLLQFQFTVYINL